MYHLTIKAATLCCGLVAVACFGQQAVPAVPTAHPQSNQSSASDTEPHVRTGNKTGKAFVAPAKAVAVKPIILEDPPELPPPSLIPFVCEICSLPLPPPSTVKAELKTQASKTNKVFVAPAKVIAAKPIILEDPPELPPPSVIPFVCEICGLPQMAIMPPVTNSQGTEGGVGSPASTAGTQKRPNE